MAILNIIDANGASHAVNAPDGVSIMTLAKVNGLPVKGTCGGKLACATCHVVVKTEWFPKLPPASQEEERLLDIVANAKQTSRLGCQIRMTPLLDGLSVRLPALKPKKAEPPVSAGA